MNWHPAGFQAGRANVRGSSMAFVRGGTGPTLLFVHGNPTSSFLWRHVLADLVTVADCVAVDLIGMGHSAKPALDYRFGDHARHLEAFADELALHDVTLVGHDWGAVLGLDLLQRRPDLITAIAICEGHLHPFDSWADMEPGAADLFSRIRTPSVGERMVLQDNIFLDQVLPGGMHHRLTDTEWAAYREPYPRPEDRLPILRWARQIPVAHDPADVDAVIRANQHTLLHAPVPRLLLHATPGAVVGATEVAWCQRNATGLDIVDIGPGTHFLPEDQPTAIAAAIRSWL